MRSTGTSASTSRFSLGASTGAAAALIAAAELPDAIGTVPASSGTNVEVLTGCSLVPVSRRGMAGAPEPTAQRDRRSR